MNIGKLSGKQIDEYELVLLIGEGGMSAVYRAYQEELDRDVAFKILSEQLTDQPGYLERFRNEARMAASLEHPNIVPVYDFGTFEDSAYVVMRLLTGGTLTRQMESDTPLRTEEILSIVNAVARALDYAHQRGIIHRDVKPGNIMFDDEGRVYLVDFGIAKLVSSDVSLTAENIVMGTPAYMAPEQWRNEPITPSVDQYALGIITYRMLTGEVPFDGQTPHQLMYQHLNQPVPPIHERNRNIPPQVHAVLAKAMAKEPGDRYPTTGDFARALQKALGTSSREQTLISPIPPVSAPAPAQDPVSYTPPAPRPAVTPRQAPLPSATRTPPQQAGDNTMLVRMAAGGGIGLILVLVFVAVAAFVLISLFGGGDDEPDDGEVQQNAPIVQQTEDVPVIAPTLRPADLPDTSIQLTPLVPESNIQLSDFGQTLVLYNQPETPIRDVAFSGDGSLIASAHGNGLVRVWYDLQRSPVVLSGHSGVVNSLAFAPDGSLLVSGGDDTTVRVWDVSTGAARTTLTGHSGAVRDVRVNAAGTMVASASEDGTVRLWDIVTGEMVRSYNVDESRALAVAFSPNGALVASGGEDGVVRVWDVSGGGLLFTLSGHSESVRGLEFSPDGRLLASSSTDNSIRLWQVDTRQTTHVLTESGADVWTVTFSPDGGLLASGDRNNNLRAWDVASGNLLATLGGHSGWVLGADFASDNTTLLSGSGDGTVRLWRVAR